MRSHFMAQQMFTHRSLPFLWGAANQTIFFCFAEDLSRLRESPFISFYKKKTNIVHASDRVFALLRLLLHIVFHGVAYGRSIFYDRNDRFWV